jgi:xylose dehydrogenase (NAD/NADP)
MRPTPSRTAYGSYDELLSDAEVEAVYIPLPTRARNEWIVKAARAKKHVYAEKPHDLDGFEDALAVCREEGVLFMDGTMWVHSKRTAAMRQLLDAGEIGAPQRVTAGFTFAAPSDEWLNGGNGRTDKTREPQGVFGDMGWYPVQAIEWAFRYELPERVQMVDIRTNAVDTIVAASGFLWFSGGRVASFDCGATIAHRSFMEVAGPRGLIRVDDLVGGQGRSGLFDAYFLPFVGSESFVHGDAKGKDTVVAVEPCDHVNALVERFCGIVRAPNLAGADEWARRSLVMHATMKALFESAQTGGSIVKLQ